MCLHIENRRYIGSKRQLTDWIFDNINKHTYNADTFCDIFAGTGIISSRALGLYKKIIINDFLYSNNIIYNAFFANGVWNKDKIYGYLSLYNRINAEDLPDNWFSVNYGDKYFAYDISKKIGYIRQDIENNKKELTYKEYCILLTTLIYNIDPLANTVGHFDAYIKREITGRNNFILKPIDIKSYNNVSIYREDANELAKKIKADIVYIDPPYNSRQYSRFYHVYESLIKWDKPHLYGVALKPKAENMSEYCRANALLYFKNLVNTINANFIVVSYNNTYNSKSHSSENKIKLENLRDCLLQIGNTKILEHNHKAFSTGKTNFDNHKEYLFITEKK